MQIANYMPAHVPGGAGTRQTLPTVGSDYAGMCAIFVPYKKRAEMHYLGKDVDGTTHGSGAFS